MKYLMTEEEAAITVERINQYLANSGLVLIQLEDLGRIRELAEKEGILEKLQALNVLVHQELKPEENDSYLGDFNKEK